jgi:hypothetical protein
MTDVNSTSGEPAFHPRLLLGAAGNPSVWNAPCEPDCSCASRKSLANVRAVVERSPTDRCVGSGAWPSLSLSPFPQVSRHSPLPPGLAGLGHGREFGQGEQTSVRVDSRFPVPTFVLEWLKFGAPERMRLGTAMSLGAFMIHETPSTLRPISGRALTLKQGSIALLADDNHTPVLGIGSRQPNVDRRPTKC